MKRVALVLSMLGTWILSGGLGLSALAFGDCKVLTGMPDYTLGSMATSDAVLAVSSDPYETTMLPADATRPGLMNTTLGNVPQYTWWYGCSPTSGGMMIAYWDSRPGCQNLYYGDASVWSGDGAWGARRMVASTAHIIAGQENKPIVYGGQYHGFGDWSNSASYPNHETNPNCLADFFHTRDGLSSSWGITNGLRNFVQWTDSAATNPLKAGYAATTTNLDVPYYGGSFDYTDLKSEINANRPVLLNVITDYGGLVGHSVVAYGYQDDMFQVRVRSSGSGYTNMTVGGFAVRDTWSAGTGQSDWYDWSNNVIYPTIDGNSVEWWPFIQTQGYSYSSRWDWQVTDAVTLNITAPEPGSLFMLVAGGASLLVIFFKKKRR